MDKVASINDHMETLEEWKKSMGKAWDDFELPHPSSQGFEGYTTFNEFFTRDLKKGARPISAINDPTVLVANADGVTNVINENLNSYSKIHTQKFILNIMSI